MKILNACNCPIQFVDFIHAAIEQTGFEVMQVKINYCGPEEIYLSLVFYDEEAVINGVECGAWEEREFRIWYHKEKYVFYCVFWGLELDAPFVCSGCYKCTKDSFQNVGEYRRKW